MCHDYWSLCTRGPTFHSKRSVEVLAAQLCPASYDPVDCTLPGPSGRIVSPSPRPLPIHVLKSWPLEPQDVPVFGDCAYAHWSSHVQFFATLWTVAPLSMGFSRQEYWSGLPFPSPGGLPNPEIKLESPVSPALAGEFFTTAPSRKACIWRYLLFIFYFFNFFWYLVFKEITKLNWSL